MKNFLYELKVLAEIWPYWLFLVIFSLLAGCATTCTQPISRDKVGFCELLCESQAKTNFPPDITRGNIAMYQNIALNREYSRSCLLACILGEEKNDDKDQN